MLTAEFLNHFSKLEDPRVTNHNTRHKFIDILLDLSGFFVAVMIGKMLLIFAKTGLVIDGGMTRKMIYV
jgi:hypothetical protein